MKIRIMAIVSIFFMVILLGCFKIYTSPPEDEALTPQESSEDTQQYNQKTDVQQQPVSSSNAGEPEPEPKEPLPDLVPTEILYDKSKLQVGTTIYFDSGIYNGGDASSKGFNIKWFVNGSELGYGWHEGVNAGSLVMTDNSQFYWKPVSSGKYTVEFVIDCDNYIAEENEENNTISASVTIP